MRQRETKGLLAVVRWRRRASQLFATLSEAYRGGVWQKLKSKLLSSQPPTHYCLPDNADGGANVTPDQDASLRNVLPKGEPSRFPHDELDDLFEVVKLGYAASRRLARGSMPYRELVWLRLQERLRTASETGHYLSAPRADAEEVLWEHDAVAPGGAAGAVPIRGPIPVVDARSPFGSGWTGGILRSLLARAWQPLAGGATARRRALATAAAMVAAAVLVFIASGGSPRAQIGHMLQTLGQRAGVQEVAEAPLLDPQELAQAHLPTTRLNLIPMSPSEAQAAMGVPVSPPRYIPPGYQQVLGAYLPPVTGPGQGTSGMYMLVYRQEGPPSQSVAATMPTIIIRYEADDKLLIAPAESVSYMAVEGMGECAYIEGSLAPGGTHQSSAGGDALVHEESLNCVKGGAAITVSYLGAEGSALGEMLRIAASIAEAQDNRCYDLAGGQNSCGQAHHWTPGSRWEVRRGPPTLLPFSV